MRMFQRMDKRDTGGADNWQRFGDIAERVIDQTRRLVEDTTGAAISIGTRRNENVLQDAGQTRAGNSPIDSVNVLGLTQPVPAETTAAQTASFLPLIGGSTPTQAQGSDGAGIPFRHLMRGGAADPPGGSSEVSGSGFASERETAAE